jgi:hypothetical protein
MRGKNSERHLGIWTLTRRSRTIVGLSLIERGEDQSPADIASSMRDNIRDVQN